MQQKCMKLKKLVRQRSYWSRSGEYVQRRVCFVNIQLSLHENVVFSVVRAWAMPRTSYLLCSERNRHISITFYEETLIQIQKKYFGMAFSLDANLAITRIHDVIQSSGLHYVINQTPWSSYVTIRKKFVNAGAKVAGDEESDMLTKLREENEKLKSKLATAEIKSVNAEESSKNVQLSLGKTVENLENALKISESKLREKDTEIIDHEQDNKRKDMIIQNMNSGFNSKMVGLKRELEELKSFKKETVKKEKKAQKKQRQKAEREVKLREVFDHTEEEKAEIKYLVVSKPDIAIPTFFSHPHSLTAIGSTCPPASPRTPPIYQSSSSGEPSVGAGTLSGYFTDLKKTTDKITFLFAECITSLSKINLAPRRTKEENT